MRDEIVRSVDRMAAGTNRQTTWVALALGAAVGTVAYATYQARTRNRVSQRRPDDAPGRVARGMGRGRRATVGRVVTIAKPRHEVYAFWRDFSNLPRFMANVASVTETDGITRWDITGPMGRDVRIESRITSDRDGEEIAWRSTGSSEIDTEGRVLFRDAPGNRGTEVEAEITYAPPGGELGRWVAKVLQAEPHLQARRDLKRLKMLMEAGEIATSQINTQS